MLNNFSLTFTSDAIEKEYRKYQSEATQTEFFVFIFVICTMGLLLIIQLVQQGFYLMASVGVGTIIILQICRCIQNKYHNSQIFVFPLIQFIIAGIGSFHSSFEKDGLDKEYFWYYGFFSSFLHVGIYFIQKVLFMQGTIIIPQFLITLLVFIWYLAQMRYTSITGIYTCTIFLLIYISMIVIRRQFEVNKRQQFIQYRENQKWFQIIENALKQTFILIKHSQESHQISVERKSIQLELLMKIANDKELRERFRKIYIVGLGKTNLEDFLREMLLEEIKQDAIISNIHGVYQKCIGYDTTTAKYYKFKLIEYYDRNEKMIMLIIDPHKKSQQQMKLNTLHKDLIKQIVHKLNQSVNGLLKPEIQNIIMFNNSLRILNLWINLKVPFNKQNFCIYHFLSYIKTILRIDIECEVSLKKLMIYNSLSGVFFTIYNLFQAITDIFQKPTSIQLEINEKDELSLIIYFIGQFPYEVKSQLEQVNFYHNSDIWQQENQLLLNQYTQSLANSLKEICNDPQRIALQFCLIKYHLKYFGITNSIICHRNQLTVSICDYTRHKNTLSSL